MHDHSTSQRLCYLDAARVAGPAGELAGATVETSAAEPLGTLDGVLIDPDERRVRYLVVERTGWLRRRKYVIPAECPAQVDAQNRALRIDVEPDALSRLDDLDEGSIGEFTDEDFVRAMFARQVA